MFSLCVFIFVSCGSDREEETKEMPTEWIGQEIDFKNDFTTKREGNETLILHRETKRPFAGKVERNGTRSITTQIFENGKLNGKSIKKSKDGSWVEAHYRDGKLHGDMIFFGKDGRRRSILRYENGQLIN